MRKVMIFLAGFFLVHTVSAQTADTSSFLLTDTVVKLNAVYTSYIPFFYERSSAMNPTYFVEAKKIISFLEKNKNIRIEIGVRCKSHSLDEGESYTLDKMRAESLKEYLVLMGAEIGRITTNGYGIDQPGDKVMIKIIDNGSKSKQKVKSKK